MNAKKSILPTIVIAQFLCTSLWFAGNAVMNNLIVDFGLETTALGHLTSAVQFGFILGTLIFAIFTIADRFSPSSVFFVSAILASIFNLGTNWEENNITTLLIIRFCTGFFLAGIYPVGMKIAADHFDKSLGKALGFLVGALVLGTAFPHLLKDITSITPWQYVIIGTSSLSLIGGLLMIVIVPDGPYRKASQKLNIFSFFGVFKNKYFQKAAFGYFGHMWELYAFWTFVPFILSSYNKENQLSINVSLFSFIIIGVGSIACILVGFIAEKIGTKKTATTALLSSCICCLISPMILNQESLILFIGFLIIWGAVVIADSPLFSTLIAKNANPELKGTALTIVNCIGFLITIFSIQLLNYLFSIVDSNSIYLILAIGPLLGLANLFRK